MSISQSAINTWLQCNRLWKYQYVDGFEPNLPPSKEQRFGIGFHKLLEFYHLGQPLDWSQVDLEGDEKYFALELIRAYMGLYPCPASTEGQQVAAELPFQYDDIHGVFDAITLVGDEVTITEHKTTKSDFSSDELYWTKVHTDWQVGMYQLAAKRMWPGKTVLVLYDAIRVPQLRQKKGESHSAFRARVAEDIADNPGRYFGQADIRWSDNSLARLEHDLEEIQHQITQAQLSGEFPRSRKCYEYRRECAFIPHCFGDTPLKDERLYRVRSRR